MSFKIVNTFVVPDADFGEDMLENMDAEVFNFICQTEDDIILHAKDAHAIIACGAYQPFTRRVWESLTKCRIVAIFSVGFDRVDISSATDLGIVFNNNQDYCIDDFSGRALSFMLALGHKIIQLNKAVREKPFGPADKQRISKEVAYPIFRMRNQTVGIVGLGKIGTATDLKVKGLGMKVIAYDPYVLGSVMKSLGVMPVDLDTLTRESDFIILHTPLTEETEEVFSRPMSQIIMALKGEWPLLAVNTEVRVKWLERWGHKA